MAQQIVIKFNIGGTRYEISQSLLQSYPDSMLAKSAAMQWHTDPNAEIFIDRDGARFRYVLDYIRDGIVHLPVYVPKASLLLDLHFFGVPVNENGIVTNIDYSFFFKSKTLVKDIIKLWENEIKSCQNKIETHQNEIIIIKNSIEIINAFIANEAKYKLKLPHHFVGETSKHCNKYLEQVGLRVTSAEPGYRECAITLESLI
jgi:hypothetical protein